MAHDKISKSVRSRALSSEICILRVICYERCLRRNKYFRHSHIEAIWETEGSLRPLSSGMRPPLPPSEVVDDTDGRPIIILNQLWAQKSSARVIDFDQPDRPVRRSP